MIAFLMNTLLYCYLLTAALVPLKTPAAKFHPLHVSSTDISYNAKEKHLEVICTIFTDDFEAAITKQYNTKTDLTRADLHAAMDILVKKYLNEHLQLKNGSTQLPLDYVGFEINREAVNVYMETGNTGIPKTVTAMDTLLQNLYTDQLNIVHITINGLRKSARLDYPDKSVTQNF